ncbi:N-acetylmuramoyl-L-alanine amidase CwlD [Eubacterium multiforme]|uniref:N-acetylmuramoyl-L-alanine amidase n=1 Tax=Eubacterium multiforme TaxID=83339 RepID=A0ABT9UU53_9FIRM|nr:N-acetylmuramoyl-L-alanine amidase CwlD [Eubacterium multiforme]MDQ0149852.1 N-acetylmuramoyl-L-alanine amidase [Eubacterium multiforme]
MKFLKSLLIAVAFLTIGCEMQVMGAEKAKEYKILIDPGHGGYDGGAKSKGGVIEKDINLQISLKLKETLKKEGYTVYMTRDDDIALSNRKKEDLEIRCEKKKETECDAFISIHQNMFSSGKSKGTQVWYSSNESSKRLAESIQQSVKETLQPNNNRLAKDAKKSYKILRDDYNGASVIVECGFLSNRDEEAKLQNDDYQNKIALEISKGVKRYFEEKPSEPILK